MTVYFGFSCSQHDPAIAVVDVDGHVVFAEAIERATKCKRGWHAPPDALGLIEPLLDRYAASDPIVANLTWSRAALASTGPLMLVSRLATAALDRLRGDDREAMLWRAWTFRHALYRAPASANQLLLNLEYRLAERNGFRPIFDRRAWNHHLCHAATACYSSPFDEALCVIMDGMGEGSSTAVFSFRDGRLTRLDRSRLASTASLGIFYSQACFAAGFDPVAGEEWKLMGLAAYGRLDEDLYHRLRSTISVDGNHLSLARNYGAVFQSIMARRPRKPIENADLAFTAQKVFADVLATFLSQAHARWGHENLIFTGGCALNSSANGQILASTPFRRLHVPMAPGDDGNAIGAALLAWQHDHPSRPIPRFASPYLGSTANNDTLARLSSFAVAPDLISTHSNDLAEIVAEALAAGAIVGWMQGRAEFGPRALGNRSILADPRNPNIKDRLNASVKFREDFRPFAPSILHEHGAHYFEDYTETPYMERTLKWRHDRAPPGVKHADETGRLHSVTAAANPRFHALLEAFHRRTNVPILLNTSFNVMGRPIIHDIEDALGVFYTADLDLLVIGDTVVRKHKCATH